MKITILNVNNDMNKELEAVYDEKQLLEGKDVRLSDNFASASTSYKLILKPLAVREIFNFIEWSSGQRNDIRPEQGGILIGKRYYDPERGIHFAIVTKAITADTAIGTAGHLNITKECWGEMHEKKDSYNIETGENAIIIGWFHTHPNMLSCFMSGTDRTTQNLFFDGINTYALVINPQRHLMKAFRSKDCYATQAFLMMMPKQGVGK